MSSNVNEEPIYTQADVDIVLAELQKIKREVELSHQLLWATVQAAGGHVQIPYSLWVGDPNRELAMWDDPQTYELNLKVLSEKEAKDV